uniref:NAC domain-containing protein n=1 Tax=Nelumbo nucifera TaxID=4432 RepID=A0A822ZKP4_NELNU|nr:TPA_asm: hypothetical protein HUJ06_001806 [Nelumbo nucifera]
MSKQEDWVLCRVFFKSRGHSAKPSVENCYDDTGSSSLPPLMDSFITFDQTPANLEEFEQVPCFSNFSQVLMTNPTLSQLAQIEPNIPTKALNNLGNIPDMGTGLNPFSCDKKVIKAVLSHLNKLESNPKVDLSPSFGEGSSESYLSEVGLPSLWNHY